MGQLLICVVVVGPGFVHRGSGGLWLLFWFVVPVVSMWSNVFMNLYDIIIRLLRYGWRIVFGFRLDHGFQGLGRDIFAPFFSNSTYFQK
jgi:hypothetical protein